MTPTLLNLIVCESVIVDAHTGMTSLMNVFNVIRTENLPYAHPRCMLFMTLTDGMGHTPLEISLIDLEDLRPIWKGPGQVFFKDKLTCVQLTTPLQLEFKKAGNYAIEVTSKSAPLGSYKLEVQYTPVSVSNL